MLIANEEQLKYMVGGLLYAPAVHKTIVRNIDAGVYGEITAVAFCLEDTIRDAALPMAEEALRETLIEAAAFHFCADPDTGTHAAYAHVPRRGRADPYRLHSSKI